MKDMFLSASRKNTAKRLVASTLITLVCTGLAACVSGAGARAPKQLDLGWATTALKSPLPPNPAVAVPAAASAALLNETMVIWRVGDTGQPQAYTSYQWVAPPARLITQRVVDRLSLQGAVLQQSVGADFPQIRLNVQRFEQTFSPDGATSKGNLTLQVVLIRGTKVVDQLLIDLSVPASTQDAPGGADALRQATDQAVEQMAQWLTVALKRK
ncbi:MAG: ABC-type transport auxiliary lipoprotein family protein [Sheuella sp.]|nr:ABC-type transport auxiliary lipoprotein family protein [Sheuella sp.]